MAVCEIGTKAHQEYYLKNERSDTKTKRRFFITFRALLFPRYPFDQSAWSSREFMTKSFNREKQVCQKWRNIFFYFKVRFVFHSLLFQ